MGMQKAKGVDLDFGVRSSGIDNVLEQSANVKKLGELKEYKDKDGNTVSVYKTADCQRQEITFEVILKQGGQDYTVGQEATIGGITGLVSAFEITESNEEAKKARVTVRTYPDVQG